MLLGKEMESGLGNSIGRNESGEGERPHSRKERGKWGTLASSFALLVVADVQFVHVDGIGGLLVVPVELEVDDYAVPSWR